MHGRLFSRTTGGFHWAHRTRIATKTFLLHSNTLEVGGRGGCWLVSWVDARCLIGRAQATARQKSMDDKWVGGVCCVCVSVSVCRCVGGASFGGGGRGRIAQARVDKNGMNATTRRKLQTILYMLLNRVGFLFVWVETLIVYVRIVGWEFFKNGVGRLFSESNWFALGVVLVWNQCCVVLCSCVWVWEKESRRVRIVNVWKEVEINWFKDERYYVGMKYVWVYQFL